MNKIIKILPILLSILLLGSVFATSIYEDTIECDNGTLIVSVCTGNMRALETGVSVYAGYNNAPLILSDETLPEQLNSWLPGYVEENNITRIIVVGPVTATQLFDFMKLGVEVKQVTGKDIPEILTKLAKNSKDIRNDSVILTASDPLAGELGAYMKVPVFVTAANGTYSSSEDLDDNYRDYIKDNQIKKVIIVGSIPESIKNQLKQNDIDIEEITGENTIELSEKVNKKLVDEGYVSNPTTAYYGFYGELPTIIPTVVRNNAILIEDSSNTGDILNSLMENNISNVVVTRNEVSDYIQMEETDYISSKALKDLENNNITVDYLVKPRTLDEATGLYDMKMLTAEEMEGNDNQTLEDTQSDIVKTQPPLLAMLEGTGYHDSNNISASITKENDSDYIVKWSTIHPYTWKKQNDDEYYATSNTGYEYFWKRQNDTWAVQYVFNNSNYYNTTWVENSDSSWTEMQAGRNFTWKYDGMSWNCYDENQELVYYITS